MECFFFFLRMVFILMQIYVRNEEWLFLTWRCTESLDDKTELSLSSKKCQIFSILHCSNDCKKEDYFWSVLVVGINSIELYWSVIACYVARNNFFCFTWVNVRESLFGREELNILVFLIISVDKCLLEWTSTINIVWINKILKYFGIMTK